MLKIYEGVENHELYKVENDCDIINEDDKTFLIVRYIETVKGLNFNNEYYTGMISMKKVEVKLIAQGV